MFILSPILKVLLFVEEIQLVTREYFPVAAQYRSNQGTSRATGAAH
jgi:hypothetical protein